jgi:dCTP deaminase
MNLTGNTLLTAAPVHPMLTHKVRGADADVSHGLSESGYDVRVVQRVQFTLFLGLFPFTKVGNGKWRYGRMALASTVERFDMPSDLTCVLHDKSTHIRRGLLVGNSVIEPGQQGHITLELFFLDRSMTIPAGSGIGQVRFSQVTDPSAYKGKYQDQPNCPVEAILG